MSFSATRATCVVEQLWPGINIDLASAQLQRVVSVASDLPGDKRPRVLGATLILDDETLLTWCAAPSTDSVRELFTMLGIPFDRVLMVVNARRAKPAPTQEIRSNVPNPTTE